MNVSRIFVGTLLIAMVSLQAQGACTSTVIGRTTIHNCDDGMSGTSVDTGVTAYHRFDNGLRGTSRSLDGPRPAPATDGVNDALRRIDAARPTERLPDAPPPRIGRSSREIFESERADATGSTGGTSFFNLGGNQGKAGSAPDNNPLTHRPATLGGPSPLPGAGLKGTSRTVGGATLYNLNR